MLTWQRSAVCGLTRSRCLKRRQENADRDTQTALRRCILKQENPAFAGVFLHSPVDGRCGARTCDLRLVESVGRVTYVYQRARSPVFAGLSSVGLGLRLALSVIVCGKRAGRRAGSHLLGVALLASDGGLRPI